MSEFVRKRTEWIAERAAAEGCDRAEMRRRLRESRARVNALIRDLSGVLHLVDYTQARDAELGWLADPDDLPVFQTALAAKADVLVTDNAADFPLSEQRDGVLILGSSTFLAVLYDRFPDARSAVAEYLGELGNA